MGVPKTATSLGVSNWLTNSMIALLPTMKNLGKRWARQDILPLPNHSGRGCRTSWNWSPWENHLRDCECQVLLFFRWLCTWYELTRTSLQWGHSTNAKDFVLDPPWFLPENMWLFTALSKVISLNNLGRKLSSHVHLHEFSRRVKN